MTQLWIGSNLRGMFHRLSGSARPLRKALLLVPILLIGLAASHAQDLALRAGAAKADITPPLA